MANYRPRYSNTTFNNTQSPTVETEGHQSVWVSYFRDNVLKVIAYAVLCVSLVFFIVWLIRKIVRGVRQQLNDPIPQVHPIQPRAPRNPENEPNLVRFSHYLRSIHNRPTSSTPARGPKSPDLYSGLPTSGPISPPGPVTRYHCTENDSNRQLPIFDCWPPVPPVDPRGSEIPGAPPYHSEIDNDETPIFHSQPMTVLPKESSGTQNPSENDNRRQSSIFEADSSILSLLDELRAQLSYPTETDPLDADGHTQSPIPDSHLTTRQLSGGSGTACRSSGIDDNRSRSNESHPIGAPQELRMRQSNDGADPLSSTDTGHPVITPERSIMESTEPRTGTTRDMHTEETLHAFNSHPSQNETGENLLETIDPPSSDYDPPPSFEYHSDSSSLVRSTRYLFEGANIGGNQTETLTSHSASRQRESTEQRGSSETVDSSSSVSDLPSTFEYHPDRSSSDEARTHAAGIESSQKETLASLSAVLQKESTEQRRFSETMDTSNSVSDLPSSFEYDSDNSSPEARIKYLFESANNAASIRSSAFIQKESIEQRGFSKTMDSLSSVSPPLTFEYHYESSSLDEARIHAADIESSQKETLTSLSAVLQKKSTEQPRFSETMESSSSVSDLLSSFEYHSDSSSPEARIRYLFE